MDRLIFLDIDGVLWGMDEGRFMPGATKLLWERFPCSTMEQLALYQKVNEDPRRQVYVCELNSTKINMLAEVINSAGVKVVVSSSWRTFFTAKEIDVLLNWVTPSWKLGTIIGSTPINGDCRALQIAAWLKEADRPLDHSLIEEQEASTKIDGEFRFAIIDDIDDGMSEMFCENFIQTDGGAGITYRDIATKLLPALALRRAGKITRIKT